MIGKLNDSDWDLLLDRIEAKKCTPFIGAGVFEGLIPSGKHIAGRWAKEYRYPIKSYEDDLVHVAQYLSVHKDPIFVKDQICKELKVSANEVDFDVPDEPHGVLASMPFPVYITTNYNDLLLQALRNKGKKPSIEICPWPDNLLTYGKFAPKNNEYEVVDPQINEPIVYYAHGFEEVSESIVITEDDHLDFLVNMSRDDRKIPSHIQTAINANTLLFIGYRPMDWSFRSILRGLVNFKDSATRKINVTIQFPPEPEDDEDLEPHEAQRYLEEYFKRKDMKAYWGTTKEFVTELRQRWDERTHG